MKIVGLDRIGRRTANGRTPTPSTRSGRGTRVAPTKIPQGCFKPCWTL